VERTFRLTLEYDGAGFEGWQIQPEGRRTVQGALEAALARVLGRRVRVVSSSRTDSGVHAEGLVASLRAETALEPDRLRRALNGVLPTDVAVLDAALAPDGFHARHDALSKLYRYRIWNGRSRSPLRARRSLCLQHPLDLAAMGRAARDLAGTHDFAAFQAAGSEVGSSERTLLRLDLEGAPGAQVDLYFEGTGFLRHMVRILSGTLIQVGRGRRDPEGMPALLASRDRRRAGPTAPAHPLSLVRVTYGDSIAESSS
jgi:tRNA pseudouridine38-40 synthase